MKLLATIQKDFRILTRDRTGLALMFAMPIVLVVVVTIIQNNTFDLLSKNRIPVLISNQDSGRFSRELVDAINNSGMFKPIPLPAGLSTAEVGEQMRSKEALLAVQIPADFSMQLSAEAKTISNKAQRSFGLESDSTVSKNPAPAGPLTILYKPEIQPSVQMSIRSALDGALQMVQSRQVLKNIYFSINEKPLSDSLEKEMMVHHMNIREVSISKDANKKLPNASQHNIPAWTVFAMFFVVMSLGGSIVREKTSGSFIRLKTLPTSYAVALLSKQVTYLLVTFFQAASIFAIGLWLFPVLGLPDLHLPHDKIGLLVVTLVCGWCAVSYALCVGVIAHTQEQANGFGAISVVILAVIGGLMIPAFAMPDSFKMILKISPLHWCLECYYGLFLEGGKLVDVLPNVLSLLAITLLLQLIVFMALKRKNLI